MLQGFVVGAMKTRSCCAGFEQVEMRAKDGQQKETKVTAPKAKAKAKDKSKVALEQAVDSKVKTKTKTKKAMDPDIAEAVCNYMGPKGQPIEGEAWRGFVKRRLQVVRTHYPGQANGVYFKIIGEEWRRAKQ